MNNLRLLTPLFLFILLCFTNASGETTYSLYDLCSIASETSEQILITKQDQIIAKQDRRRALSVLMPRATTFAGSKTYRDPDYSNPDVSTMGVKLNQSFTLNGKELIALNITRDSIDQTGFNLESVQNRIVFQVAEAFYQILSAQSFKEIARSDVERLTKHKDSVQRRLDLGDVTKTALFRARAEQSKAQTELLKANNNLTLARASLRNLVTMDDTFFLTEPTNIEAPSFTLSDLKAAALQRRPELKEYQSIVDIAKKTIKLNKSDRWPTLALEGIYADSRSKFDDPLHVVSNQEEYSLEAVLSFNLFDGGLISAQVAQALAKERQAQFTLDSIKRDILLEVEQAWLDFQTAESTLKTLKDELTAATENLNAVEMQFKYGISDSVDMMDANTLFVTAQKRLSDAAYNHSLSILRIITARGDIFSYLVLDKS